MTELRISAKPFDSGSHMALIGHLWIDRCGGISYAPNMEETP